MYEWTLGINGYVLIGRRWEEFMTVCEYIHKSYSLDDKNILIIYVHNLSFEFQFLRKRFNWKSVFSLDERKPIRALTDMGIEFRCSYLLSGYSLAKLAEQLTEYSVEKMVGDLDYNLVRHAETPLTEKELKYCINDVLVAMAFIAEKIHKDGDITQIQLTKTGYVRDYCRKECFWHHGSRKDNEKVYYAYRKLINSLTLTPIEYAQLKRVFMGGFTHANHFYVDKILHNIRSFDFTSSYPAVMCSEMFPMSNPEHIVLKSKEEFLENLENYCCMFDIEFSQLESRIEYEHPLSKSKCATIEGYIEDNGRIVYADRAVTSLTELDYKTFSKFYKWKNCRIFNFRRFKKGYLPKDLILSVLKFYGDKTKLKGVEGKEVEYLNSKENANSTYGMMVTDICRDEIVYTDEWGTMPADIDEIISRYNKSRNRFLYYPWGVWITAYARYNLFSGILAFGNDYVYSDTDSIKVRNYKKHIKYIQFYNKVIKYKLDMCLSHYGIPTELTAPKTIKGVTKQLGEWDDEGMYSRFKTLGAKRYMTEKDGKISLTVAGLNKHVAIPYLLDKFGDRIFENFTDELYVPPEHTGKLTHTYLDYEQSAIVEDYLGNIEPIHELSSIHLSPCDFTLSLTENFKKYLQGKILEMR